MQVDVGDIFPASTTFHDCAMPPRLFHLLQQRQEILEYGAEIFKEGLFSVAKLR